MTLGSAILILDTTGLWLEDLRTILWTNSFKAVLQSYNRIDIHEDGSTLKKHLSGVEFQIFLEHYQTWGLSLFFVEYLLQAVPERSPKWEPRSRSGVYLRNYTFNEGYVEIVLNIINGDVIPPFHVVFNEIFCTIEQTIKLLVPVNWKNLVYEHSDLSMQYKITLSKEYHLN